MFQSKKSKQKIETAIRFAEVKRWLTALNDLLALTVVRPDGQPDPNNQPILVPLSMFRILYGYISYWHPRSDSTDDAEISELMAMDCKHSPTDFGVIALTASSAISLRDLTIQALQFVEVNEIL